MADALAKLIGLASIFIGVFALITTTISYFKKGNEINNQTFKFSRLMVIYLSISLSLFSLYLVFILCIYGDLSDI